MAPKAPAPCAPSVAPHVARPRHAPQVRGCPDQWSGASPAAPVSVSEPAEPVEPQEPAEACAALARIEAGMAELQRALRELDLSALEVDAAEYAEAAAAWAPLVAEGAEDFMASLANLEELQNLEDLEHLEGLGGLEGLKHLAELYALEACGTGSDCGHECCQDAEAQELGAHAAEAARKALAEVERSLGRSGGESAAQAYARALELAKPFTAAPAQGATTSSAGCSASCARRSRTCAARCATCATRSKPSPTCAAPGKRCGRSPARWPTRLRAGRADTALRRSALAGSARSRPGDSSRSATPAGPDGQAGVAPWWDSAGGGAQPLEQLVLRLDAEPARALLASQRSRQAACTPVGQELLQTS